MSKLLSCFTAIIIGFLTLTAYADIPAVQPAQSSNSNALSDLSLIFMQNASSATIQPIKNRPGYYYLILNNTGPYITYFTSRPHRFRGLVPVSEFIQAWGIGENNFKLNNPNGAIIAGEISGEDNTGNPPLLVTLSEPTYSANQNVMAYVVTPLFTQSLFLTVFTMSNVTLVIGS